MKVIKNFLEDSFFQDLKKLVIESEFSWFKRKNMLKNNDDDLGYFTHSFFNKNTINCKHYNQYILPILDQLEVKAPIEVRANLSPSCFYKKNACAFHVDRDYDSKTAILYLNDCNGGTEFKINNKIELVKAEENKIVIFDTNTQHRGTKSTDQDFRYIINFNYF
tara:strand:+ start:547 stop:1038 length:492 start_codon:yes stop_codon:yes gene_type:complete